MSQRMHHTLHCGARRERLDEGKHVILCDGILEKYWNLGKMLSHRFQTIFIHVPKTAGQSVERVFLEKHGLTWETRSELLLRENPDPSLGPRRLAHLYAREYVDKGYVSL